MKTCSKCDIEVGRTNHSGFCRPCYLKNYYSDDEKAEKKRQTSIRWNADHKDRRRQISIEWQRKNPERTKEIRAKTHEEMITAMQAVLALRRRSKLKLINSDN